MADGLGKDHSALHFHPHPGLVIYLIYMKNEFFKQNFP